MISKNEIVEKYKEPIITAIDVTLDELKVIGENSSVQKTKESINLSIKNYSNLKEKVKNNKELNEVDFASIGVILSSSVTRMTCSAEKLIESAEELKTVAAAMFARS